MRQTTLNEILDIYFICVLYPVLIIPMFIWIFFPLVAGLSINDDYAYRTECMFFAVCIWLYTIWNWMVVGELIGLPFEASLNLSPNLKILIIASLLFLAVLPSVLKRMKLKIKLNQKLEQICSTLSAWMFISTLLFVGVYFLDSSGVCDVSFNGQIDCA